MNHRYTMRVYHVMLGLQPHIDAPAVDTSTDNSASLSLHRRSQCAADRALPACSVSQDDHNIKIIMPHHMHRVQRCGLLLQM